MSSNSENFESNKDLDMQAEPPEAQDAVSPDISPDEATLSIHGSKALETHENNTDEMKIQKATSNEVASAITDDSVHVSPDSNQSNEDSELSTNIPVKDKELSSESPASELVFEGKPPKQSDSASLGQKENQINEDPLICEPNLIEDSKSEARTNLNSETTGSSPSPISFPSQDLSKPVSTSETYADNLAHQDEPSTTEMDVDVDLPVADEDEVIETITAGQDADVEVPTNDNLDDVELPTTDNPDDVKPPTTDNPDDVKPPTTDNPDDVKPPTTDNPDDVKPPTTDKDADIKQSTTVTNVNVELPTVNKDADVELPAVDIDADVELPAIDIDADVELSTVDKDEDHETHAAGKDENVEPCIADKDAGVEPHTIEKDADVRLSTAELPTFDMNSDLELCPSSQDDIELQTADKNANVEPLTMERDEDVELLPANTHSDEKLPVADKDANVKLPIVEMNTAVKLPSVNEVAKLPTSDVDIDLKLAVDMNADAEPSAEMDVDVQLPTSEMDVDLKLAVDMNVDVEPPAEMDVDVQLPTSEVDADDAQAPTSKVDADDAQAPTIEAEENVHLPVTENDADIQCSTENKSVNVVKSADGINKDTELHTDDMNADVSLPSPDNSNDNLNIHKGQVDTEVELIADQNEVVKDIPTEKSSVESQPIKATKDIEGSTVDLNAAIELPSPVNDAITNHTDQISVDDPTADSNVANDLPPPVNTTCVNPADKMNVDDSTADSNVATELTVSQQNSEVAPSSSTVPHDSGAKRTIPEDASPTGELNSNAVKEPSDEPKTKKRKLDDGVNNYPAGLYLDNTIVPILRMALITLDRLRPQDPMQFIIDFLLQNKEKYSVTHEPLSNA